MSVVAYCFFLIWLMFSSTGLCRLLTKKSLEHVVKDHKPRNFTQSIYTSFCPPTPNFCSYCLMCPFTIFWSLSFSLYSNFAHLLYLDLFVILNSLNIIFCLWHWVDCFIYFKALPARCSRNLVVLWSNDAFDMAFSLWAQRKWDCKKTQGGIR